MLTLYINIGSDAGHDLHADARGDVLRQRGNFTVTDDLIVQGALVGHRRRRQFTGHVTVNGTLTLNGNLVLSSTDGAWRCWATSKAPRPPAFNHTGDTPVNGGRAGLITRATTRATTRFVCGHARCRRRVSESGRRSRAPRASSVLDKSRHHRQGDGHGSDRRLLGEGRGGQGGFRSTTSAAAAKLTNPQILIGHAGGTTAGTGGPNNNPSIDFTFHFTQPFANEYKIALSVSGGWLVANVKVKALDQCTVSVGNLDSPTPIAVTCDIICVGN